MALLSGRSQGSRHSLLAKRRCVCFCETAAPATPALPKALLALVTKSVPDLATRDPAKNLKTYAVFHASSALAPR